MDVLEIFSQIRNIKGVQIEDEIPTRPLLRAINLGFRTLCKQIKPIILPSLGVVDFSEAGATTQVFYPEDFCEPVNVYRDDIKCSPLVLAEKPLIGNNINYPSDINQPLFIDQGEHTLFFPATSSTIKIDYLRWPPDLLFGSGAVATKLLTLFDGRKTADLYNNTFIALYQRVEASLTHQANDLITDYSAAQVATLRDTTTLTGCVYASVPLIPEKFHKYIADYSLIELAKMGFVDPGVAKLAAEVLSTTLTQESAI